VTDLSLRPDLSAMGEARDYVRSRLGEVLSASRLADVELMTSELVSNAVQHPSPNGAIRLELDIRSADVRVSVIDAGAGFDLAAVKWPRELGGWGLFIVEQVSDRWGIEDEPHRVWFEIDR
jgi:anti-sigma regulatory factor (Ser/Thr protein kinase)